MARDIDAYHRWKAIGGCAIIVSLAGWGQLASGAPPEKPFIRIIDDGTVGYEETGHDWKTFGEDHAIGEHYRAHLGVKSADTASWKFSGLKSGLRCDVYASWVGWENRSTSAAFTIKDGATILATPRVNQVHSPADATFAGAWWAKLGTFTISSGTLAVVLSAAPNPTIVADAVCLVEVVPGSDSAQADVSEALAESRRADAALLKKSHKPGASSKHVKTTPLEPSPAVPPTTQNPKPLSPGEIFRRPQLQGAATPSETAQKETLALIREVYKEDYAKKRPGDRAALAEHLLEQLGKIDDATQRYVLLSEARESARADGNALIVIRAADEMSKRYAIDKFEVTADALERIDREALAANARADTASAILNVADAAAAARRYDAAKRLLAVAVTVSRKVGDAEWTKRIGVRNHDVLESKSRYDAASKAAEVLATSPQDPAANLALGKYLCFVLEDWPQGLPYLAKGGDSGSSKVAAQELAAPASPNGWVAVADAWRAAAEKAGGLEKTAILAHARHHYEQALPRLQGLARTKVKNRLDELDAAQSPPPVKDIRRPTPKGR